MFTSRYRGCFGQPAVRILPPKRPAKHDAILRKARRTDPFASGVIDIGGKPTVYTHLGAEDRLRVLKSFDAAECRLALALPNLQKTVRTALERRLRKLGAAPKVSS